MSADGSDQDAGNEAYKSILLAVLPKITAFMSMTCSSALIAKICLRSRNKEKVPSKTIKIQDRIMLGLSTTDILASLCYFLGTWLVPKGTIGGFGPVFGAYGNEGTCNLSGFFTQFAVASPMYNATLACYYLLRIYCTVQESVLVKVEKYFHIVPIAFAFFTALVAFCFNMYGNVDWLCWINPNPQVTAAHKAVKVFQWVFLFGPIWICVIFQSIVMYLLFRKMRGFEKAMNQFSFTNQRNYFEENMNMTKKGDLLTTNISSAETVDRNLPSFVGKDTMQEVSKLSMCGPISEVEKLDDYHQTYENSENKDNKVISNEEVTCGADLDSEKDGESMVRISNLGNSISSVSTLDNKTIENDDDDIESANILSAVKEDENEEHTDKEDAPLNYEKNSNSYRYRETSLDSDSYENQSGKDYIIEEEKTEIEANRRRSVVTFQNNSRQSLMSEHREDSFLPDLKDDKNFNYDDDDDDDDNIEQGKNASGGLRMSTKFASILSKMSGRHRSSGHSSMSSNEKRKHVYHTNRKSRTIAIQGILYVCAFYVTWLFPTIMRFTQFAGKTFYPIQLLDSTLLPMQGFFNFFIYIRPQYVKHREMHREHGFWKSLKEVILSH
mmetsp:Transcript_16851/g.21316  ORF Transcript_16851/g.21316 Transcript_16851/m.21316 type:complete len:611 (+) Transcript_16851:114-1946(+)|eukprot:CAMPEP_0203673290 /NCGR_PEP_ID=MMETSP0090-20130426/11796_1 /ASSEMBLY_ACC=CAM_ASM_001088 /TAXON_ID=426623 /ORGANISM="Chaetoceros affinis, Strain CCMP159" /LENGTH=610 /DNA_ID=CAMNT_0050538907 /DNA_START=44 /DNA_END=1876 /DNA_ORIENTATION=+